MTAEGGCQYYLWVIPRPYRTGGDARPRPVSGDGLTLVITDGGGRWGLLRAARDSGAGEQKMGERPGLLDSPAGWGCAVGLAPVRLTPLFTDHLHSGVAARFVMRLFVGATLVGVDQGITRVVLLAVGLNNARKALSAAG